MSANDYDWLGKGVYFWRAAFQEGEPIYPGSAIYTLTHIQIAIRDRTLITDIRAYEP